MQECQTAGEPCTGHHECCTGACADPGTGVPICQYVSGCRPIGEVCDAPEQCCSGLCNAYLATGVKRCEKPTGCMPAGEVCWTGQSANCCPQGREGGTALCLPTFSGVSRCWSPDTVTVCRESGQPCALADDCCSRVCLPDATNQLVCGANCVPLQGVCTANSDCCEAVCLGGTCQPTTSDCVPFGGPCTTAAECCDNVCDPSGHCSVTVN
jgi:hypothetical protein